MSLIKIQQVDRLQQILFYRELDFQLSAIRTLLDSPDFHREAALQSHLAALEERQARLGALILTVRNTIDGERGGHIMSDLEKFQCFKEKVIKNNEATYGQEVRATYGNPAMDDANARISALDQEAYEAMTALEADIRTQLESAVLAGQAPEGEAGLALARLHKAWLSYSWSPKQYTPQAHRGLAALYTEDARFCAYYDRTVPGCARFLRQAIEAHI